jgi:SPP1 family predicted phage head-tail adaptor
MACAKTFASMAKNKITIKSPVLTVSDMGGQSSTFNTFGTFWAILEPKSGREIFTQGSIQTRVSHTAVIRYQAAMSNPAAVSNWIVEFNNRKFTIIALMNLDKDMKTEGNDFQKLMLEENGADQFG